MHPGSAPRVLFETRRLRARQLVAADLDALHAVYSDPLGARWVDDGQPISREDSARWIEVTLGNYASRGYGMTALTLRADAAVIGFCGLVHPGGQEDAEIKYALARDCWGCGYASECVPAMLAWGARAQGLGRIIATIHPDNLASQRVVTKAGMRAEPDRFDDDGTRTLVYGWAPVAGVAKRT